MRADEGDVFHDRLSHSIKVAQVGRRLAERCLSEFKAESQTLRIEPEVVEAACLAHDIGHPPFGHIGEKVLNELVGEDNGGYEGNAQSFRILTKLAVRFQPPIDGLNLTRATLAAVLKYPWMRNINDPSKSKKWNAYCTEKEDFEFALEAIHPLPKSCEAELMDFADDIAYSVHDLEDFHRCGIIPWNQIGLQSEQQSLTEETLRNWYRAPENAEEMLVKAFSSLSQLVTLCDGSAKAYDGSIDQRRNIRLLTSSLIKTYVNCFSLRITANTDEYRENYSIVIPEEFQAQIKILKQITKKYVIANPALSAQQHGYQKIIKNLYCDFIEDIKNSNSNPQRLQIVPNRFKHLVETEASSARIAADCVAGLSEQEAIALHARLQGIVSGSVLDPIVR